MQSLSLFFESWDLFWQPTLAGALAGATLGFLGVYVVARRMVFLSAALSQIAGLGVALAFWLKVATGIALSPLLGASAATLAGIFGVMSDKSPNGARRDSVLGVLFLLGSAGTLAVGTRIVEEVQDIQSLLFGSAVAILQTEFWILVSVLLTVTLLHLWWGRGFIAVSVDQEDSRVRGIRLKLVDAVLLGTIALSIGVSTRVLGALPTFAFSILPAFAALHLAPNIPRAMFIAAGIGAASGFFGYVLAFAWELPVGASQTLIAVMFVFLVQALSLRLGRK